MSFTQAPPAPRSTTRVRNSDDAPVPTLPDPPEGLLLETTDVRKGKPDRPPPVSSPRAPPLPTIRRAVKGTRAQPSVSFQPSPAQGPGRCSAVSPPRAPQQPRRGGYAMPWRGASLSRRNRAGNEGKVWSRSGGLQRRPGGSQVLSPGHPGLTRDPSTRRRHPSLPQTPLPAATTNQGAVGSAPHQARDRWRRVTMATHGARRPAPAFWNPLT